MSNILIVDDEVGIREVLKEYAEFEGHRVFEAENGMDAVASAKSNDIDLILMDIMMPKLDGYSAIKEINKFKKIPTIMLSARAEEYDKLFGFELGVDDYVTKPFSPREVMARVNAVLNRATPPVVENEMQIYNFGNLEINMSGREVKISGTPLTLTPKEYELLFYLVRNKDIAVSRETLLTEVWGYDFYGDDRTVDTHIKMLRQTLGEYRNSIITLRGLGYKFSPAAIKD